MVKLSNKIIHFMNQPFFISHLIEDGQGMRLDRWLRHQYPALTQGTIEKLLRLGKIRLDGQKTLAKTRVTIGQIITVSQTLGTIPQRQPLEKKIDILTDTDIAFLEEMILWEDEDILVLNKPQGLATQGGSKTFRHLDGLLSAYGARKGTRFRLVHRLDRDTSGVLVVAKTIDAATFLANAFRCGDVHKVYWAIVLGQPKPGQGDIKAPLLKGASGNQEKIAVDPKGKSAITHYRTIKGLQKNEIAHFAWLELSPETGRTHQLRVHTAHIGNPILGDGKYGGQKATAASRNLHLHARTLTFPDRLTGAPLTFAAPLPSHFQETLSHFKIDWERMI